MAYERPGWGERGERGEREERGPGYEEPGRSGWGPDYPRRELEGPDYYGPGFRGRGYGPWWQPIPRYGRYEPPGPYWSEYGGYEPGEAYRARGWSPGRYEGGYGGGFGTSGYTGYEPWREPYREYGAGYEREGYRGELGAGGPAGPEWRGYEGTRAVRGQRYGSQPRFGRETPGRYAGRGPRTYHRTDERIEEEINEELTRAPDIDASDIEVKVQNGIVTLTGTVEEREMKRIAEDLAEAVTGVKEVQNRLRVGAGQPAGMGAGGEAPGSRATEAGGQRREAERGTTGAGRGEPHRESGRTVRV